MRTRYISTDISRRVFHILSEQRTFRFERRFLSFGGTSERHRLVLVGASGRRRRRPDDVTSGAAEAGSGAVAAARLVVARRRRAAVGARRLTLR